MSLFRSHAALCVHASRRIRWTKRRMSCIHRRFKTYHTLFVIWETMLFITVDAADAVSWNCHGLFLVFVLQWFFKAYVIPLQPSHAIKTLSCGSEWSFQISQWPLNKSQTFQCQNHVFPSSEWFCRQFKSWSIQQKYKKYNKSHPHQSVSHSSVSWQENQQCQPRSSRDIIQSLNMHTNLSTSSLLQFVTLKPLTQNILIAPLHH